MNLYFLNSDEKTLNLFLSSCTEELTSFRYFCKRSLDIHKNHILSKIIMLDDLPIAYFHLEIENNKCWFGICVNKMYQGIGLSSLIINYVKVFCALNNIVDVYLTVDNDNTVAINTYTKQGFTVVKNNINNTEMCLKIKGFKNV